MLDWLDRLRQKPKFVRDQVAFFAAVFVTGVIAVGWTITLPGHFAQIDSTNTPEKEAIGAFAQFFSDIKSNAAAVIKSSLPLEYESNSLQEAEENQNDLDANPDKEFLGSGNSVPILNPQTIKEINTPKPRPALIATSTESASESDY